MKRCGGFVRAAIVAQAVFALAGCDGELVVQASDPPVVPAPDPPEEPCDAAERPVSVEWEVTVHSAPDAAERALNAGLVSISAHGNGNVSIFSRTRSQFTSEGVMAAGLSWTTLAPNGDVVADRIIDGPFEPNGDNGTILTDVYVGPEDVSVGPDGTVVVVYSRDESFSVDSPDGTVVWGP